MKIQIVTNKDINYGESICVNSINAPMSFDDYDINIIDISAESLWRYDGGSFATINDIADFKSVGTIVSKTNKSTVVFVLPQNCQVYWHHSNGRYVNSDELKNRIDFLVNQILKVVIPTRVISDIELTYERNKTRLGNTEYYSDFFFSSQFIEGIATLAKSTSEKPTTIVTREGFIVTTCNVMQSRESVINYIKSILSSDSQSEIPEWVDNYSFYNDIELKDELVKENEVIKSAQSRMSELNDMITQNNHYKSVLFSSGDQLVKVVFEILQKTLNVDLSEFEDDFKEDFLIERNDKIFVGEIKGVNSNVQYGHIDQAVRHFGEYADNHPECDEKRIKPLLIINRLRNTPINEREPINIKQIDHAKKNNCLIIDTSSLLRLFEKALCDELNTEKCEEMLFYSSGELIVE